MTKRSPELVARIREMAPDHTAKDIARAIGVSLPSVRLWAALEGIALMTPSEAQKKAWADPALRARMSEAQKKAWAERRVKVPHWVPADLHEDYLDVAAMSGAEAAAAHVRQLKREAAA